MTNSASTAYACVAFRIMEYERQEISEEYLELLINILYDFYTEMEIKKIYVDNIQFDSYEAVVNDKIIKSKMNE